jgi:hypothetical protein
LRIVVKFDALNANKASKKENRYWKSQLMNPENLIIKKEKKPDRRNLKKYSQVTP